jgi:hypothetical protein
MLLITMLVRPPFVFFNTLGSGKAPLTRHFRADDLVFRTMTANVNHHPGHPATAVAGIAAPCEWSAGTRPLDRFQHTSKWIERLAPGAGLDTVRQKAPLAFFFGL